MDSFQNLMDLLYKRRSVRVYDAARPVERDKITLLLQAAMAAPSACNLQPWEFIVVDEPEGVTGLKECIDGDNGRSYNAPAAFVVCANTSYIPWDGDGSADCSAAVENILLTAAAMELGAVWIGAFDSGAVRRRLCIPEHVLLHAIVLFGYPAEQKQPRTQYTEEAVYWQRYDPDREHPKRTTALRFL